MIIWLFGKTLAQQTTASNRVVKTCVIFFLLNDDSFSNKNIRTSNLHTGAATYFVQRIPDKPSGWFSQTGEGFNHSGLSFTLDPIYHDPNDERWHAFLKESVRFARAHGGRVAVTQTRFITPNDYFAAPGNIPLKEAPNHRFTSPFFQPFTMVQHEEEISPPSTSTPSASVTTEKP